MKAMSKILLSNGFDTSLHKLVAQISQDDVSEPASYNVLLTHAYV